MIKHNEHAEQTFPIDESQRFRIFIEKTKTIYSQFHSMSNRELKRRTSGLFVRHLRDVELLYKDGKLKESEFWSELKEMFMDNAIFEQWDPEFNPSLRK